ncbi:hypothetical protein ACTFIU_008423 [Dictyostelium citrinum]
MSINLIPNLFKNSRIPIGKQQFYNAIRNNNSKRKSASVAVILRVDSKYNNIFDHCSFKCICNSKRNDHKEKCINTFIQSLINNNNNRNNNNSNNNNNNGLLKNDKNIPLELLYLKRFSRNGNNGEVCFPGGKIELNETEQEAAERETLEEVSIDLKDSNNFTLIGQLDDKFTYDQIGVHSFIYLQLCKETPKIILSPNELVDYGWVNLDYILNSNNNNRNSKRGGSFIKNSENNNDIEKIQFTTVSEITISKRLKSSYLLRKICDHLYVPYLMLPIVSTYQFRLWGLTLDITSDLLKRLTGSSPIPNARAVNNSLLLYITRNPYKSLFIFSTTFLSILITTTFFILND